MEPEQEHLSKLYSGSGIHSLPELNPNFMHLLIIRNKYRLHSIHTLD